MWWKKYNPQGGSLLPCIVTQGRLRYTCQPCAIESITATRYGHTAWFGAIECAMGNGTPQCLVEMGRGGLHMDGWFPLGGLHVNGSFVCVGLCGKI